MAEEETGQEKTEEATPRRLERAREEGQVPRSRELNTAAVLLAGSGGMLAFGPAVSAALLEVGRASFTIERAAMFDTSAMAIHLESAGAAALLSVSPLLALLLLAASVAPILLGGWLFSSSSLAPRFGRLDPVSGLQRMFSLRAVVELLKAVAKVLVVGSVAALLLVAVQQRLLGLGDEAINPAIAHAVAVIGWSALVLSASTLLIAAVDVPFQLFDHARKLRMTHQQIRDEMKETEGRPEVKSRIRQLQRQMARARMMSAVPKADVVITNPTHYAVALRYDVANAGAPMLLAKGTDLVALRIREIAEAHGIPVVRSPKLARAIFYTTEIEAEIPAVLYMAVAQVLAHVFHLRSWRRNGGPAPKLPDELPVPDGLDRGPGAADAEQQEDRP